MGVLPVSERKGLAAYQYGSHVLVLCSRQRLVCGRKLGLSRRLLEQGHVQVPRLQPFAHSLMSNPYCPSPLPSSQSCAPRPMTLVSERPPPLT